MSTDRVRINLTKEQQEQVKQACGEDVQAVELSVEELEQRVAPVVYFKYNMQTAFITS